MAEKIKQKPSPSSSTLEQTKALIREKTIHINRTRQNEFIAVAATLIAAISLQVHDAAAVAAALTAFAGMGNAARHAKLAGELTKETDLFLEKSPELNPRYQDENSSTAP